MQCLLNEYKVCWIDHIKLHQVPEKHTQIGQSLGNEKVNLSNHGWLAKTFSICYLMLTLAYY